MGLRNKYQDEKAELLSEWTEIETRQANKSKEIADVNEFVRRLKSYMQVPALTREMCMELIEFVTADKCPGKYSKEPREIHICYKLIDKTPPPEKKYLDGPMCEDIWYSLQQMYTDTLTSKEKIYCIGAHYFLD